MTRRRISSGSRFEAALREADAYIADIVRVRYILPDASEFPLCWPVLRRWLGDVRPAATMWSAGLIDPAIRIEIEVTARRQSEHRETDQSSNPSPNGNEGIAS